jgi:hypothetical protein
MIQPVTPPPAGPGFGWADPQSRLAPFYVGTSHIVAVVALALTFVGMSYIPLHHTDIWGHLRFGEYMVRQGALPRHEMFSGGHADQEAPYINFQWLSQAGAFLIFDLGRRLAAPDFDNTLGGGAALLAATHAALVTLRLLLLLIAFHRLSGSLPLALAGVGLVLVMTFFNHLAIIRPQVVGEPFFAALLVPLSRSVLSRRALVLVPLLFIFWANSHGSFLVGLALPGLFLLGQLLTQVGQWRTARLQQPGVPAVPLLLLQLRQDRQLRRLAAVLLLSLLAAALVNPHGPALLLHSAALARHPNIRFMEEWKRLPLGSPSGVVFLGSVLLLALLWFASPRRFTPTQMLLLVAFGWQAVSHARMLIWWIMIFAWVAVPHLEAAWRRFLPRPEPPPPDLRKTLLACLAGLVLLLWSAPVQWLVWGEAPRGSRRVSSVTPVEAAHYLRKQYERDEGQRMTRCIFTSETLGDYLLWELRLDPPVRIFCYTHVHLLRPEHWLECMQVKLADRGWQEVLDRHGVDFLVVEHDLYQQATGFSNLVDQVRISPERWQIVAERPVFMARRRAPFSRSE